MKALIIGGAGFVGNYLIDAIQSDLLCSVCVTKRTHSTIARQDVVVEDLDIMDGAAIFALLQRETPDYIFHLAAQSSISHSWKDPSQTVAVNVKGSLNLMDAVRRLAVQPRVLLVGSGEEYGHIAPDAVPVRETELLRPGNIYAATKACQNMMATVYSKAYDMPLVMVRAFNHMGPGQSATFVVSDFCRQVARIEAGLQTPVIRVGNLAAKRDFTDVRDVVHAYTGLVQFGLSGEIYNVGSGHALAIRSILDAVLAESTVPIRVEQDQAKLRPIDVPIIEADISKLYNATGWMPKIPLKETICDTLNDWRSRIAQGAET